jgi:hypothetical protein
VILHLKRYSGKDHTSRIENPDHSVTIDNKTIEPKCELIGNQILQLDSDALDKIFVNTKSSVK